MLLSFNGLACLNDFSLILSCRKLHIAIAKCIAPVAKRIIDLAPTIEDLNRINSQKLSPLHMAVLTNQPELTRYLLLRGAMLEIRDEDGNTPLHLACALGHHACILALTESLTGSESVISGSIPFQQIPQDMDIKNYDGKEDIFGRPM